MCKIVPITIIRQGKAGNLHLTAAKPRENVAHLLQKLQKCPICCWSDQSINQSSSLLTANGVTMRHMIPLQFGFEMTILNNM